MCTVVLKPFHLVGAEQQNHWMQVGEQPVDVYARANGQKLPQCLQDSYVCCSQYTGNLKGFWKAFEGWLKGKWKYIE